MTLSEIAQFQSRMSAQVLKTSVRLHAQVSMQVAPQIEVMQELVFQIDAAPQSLRLSNLNMAIADNRMRPVKSHDNSLQCEQGLVSSS